jgi:hypothetical protein
MLPCVLVGALLFTAVEASRGNVTYEPYNDGVYFRVLDLVFGTGLALVSLLTLYAVFLPGTAAYLGVLSLSTKRLRAPAAIRAAAVASSPIIAVPVIALGIYLHDVDVDVRAASFVLLMTTLYGLSVRLPERRQTPGREGRQ